MATGPIPGTGEWQLAAEASGQEIQKYFQEPTSIGCSGSYGMIKKLGKEGGRGLNMSVKML